MSKGFTLIEVIIYIALFSFIVGGGLVATYQIIQGGNSLSSNLTVQEEANFLLRKIDWALTGWVTTGAVSTPTSGSSVKLVVTKPGTGQLTFDVSSGALRLQRGSGTPAPLSTGNVVVASQSFQRIVISGKPDAIRATFTMSLINSSKSYQFETIKYLRQ